MQLNSLFPEVPLRSLCGPSGKGSEVFSAFMSLLPRERIESTRTQSLTCRQKSILRSISTDYISQICFRKSVICLVSMYVSVQTGWYQVPSVSQYSSFWLTDWQVDSVTTWRMTWNVFKCPYLIDRFHRFLQISGIFSPLMNSPAQSPGVEKQSRIQSLKLWLPNHSLPLRSSILEPLYRPFFYDFQV